MMSEKWFIKTKSGKRGPYTIEQLQRYVDAGAIRPNAGIGDGEHEWVTAISIPGLKFPDEAVQQIRASNLAAKVNAAQDGAAKSGPQSGIDPETTESSTPSAESSGQDAPNPEAEKRQAELDARERQIQEQQRLLDDRLQVIESREEQLDQVSKHLTEREQKLDIERAEFESQQTELAEKEQAAIERAEQAESQLAEQQAQLAEQQSQLGEVQSQLSQLETELESEKRDLGERVSELQRQLSAKAQELDEQVASAASASETKSELESEIQSLRQQLAELATALESAKDEAEEQSANIASAQQATQATETELQATRQQVTELTSTLESAEQELQRLKNELAEQAEAFASAAEADKVNEADTVPPESAPAAISVDELLAEKKKLLGEFAARQESLSRREAELIRREDELLQRELVIAEQVPGSDLSGNRSSLASAVQPRPSTDATVTAEAKTPASPEAPATPEPASPTVLPAPDEAEREHSSRNAPPPGNAPRTATAAKPFVPSKPATSSWHLSTDNQEAGNQEALPPEAEHLDRERLEFEPSPPSSSSSRQGDGRALAEALQSMQSGRETSQETEHEPDSDEVFTGTLHAESWEDIFREGSTTSGTPQESSDSNTDDFESPDSKSPAQTHSYESVVEFRKQIYESKFGPCLRYDEDRDAEMRIDISIHGPHDSRDYTTLVTSGMSDYPIAMPNGQRAVCAELLLYVTHVDESALKILRTAAKAPYQRQQGLSIGTTATLNQLKDEMSGSPQQDAVYLLPTVESDSKPIPAKDYVGNSIQLFWLLTITDQERKLIETNGIHKFLSLLEKNNHTVYFDLMRDCYVKRKAWFRR
ncbi:suppressor of fused domain protein [Roseiconus lacunae]|uniref:suppressor of fused domain protein n=1 Tax=Roseiconus lacunae TaxID=2605694 RepID=UPI001E62F968|nr:suppressor of fused domain protein [Roseiconus lacunae]MCD0458323.1 suppressor of fused domain protein [Roseiconus lacunae]